VLKGLGGVCRGNHQKDLQYQCLAYHTPLCDRLFCGSDSGNRCTAVQLGCQCSAAVPLPCTLKFLLLVHLCGFRITSCGAVYSIIVSSPGVRGSRLSELMAPRSLFASLCGGAASCTALGTALEGGATSPRLASCGHVESLLARLWALCTSRSRWVAGTVAAFPSDLGTSRAFWSDVGTGSRCPLIVGVALCPAPAWMWALCPASPLVADTLSHFLFGQCHTLLHRPGP
jgi:hypothetical protein